MYLAEQHLVIEQQLDFPYSINISFLYFYSVHLKWLIGYIVHELVMADIDQTNVLFFKLLNLKPRY